MAVAQRIFNSTRPFSMSTDQPKLKALNCLSSSTELQSGNIAGKTDKQHDSAFPNDYPNCLLKYISHGTAKHIGTGPLGTEKPSIIAQAECESQDSQEFCPNSRYVNISTSNLIAALNLAQGSSPHQQPKKKRRKRQRKRYTDAEVQQRDGGRETRLTRFPEQDSGELGECSYSSSLSRAGSTESLSIQETSGFSHLGLHSTLDSSTPNWKCPTTYLIDANSYALESQFPKSSEDPDSPLISEVQCLALVGLRRNVTQDGRSYAPAFAKQMVRDWKDREEEAEESDTNEGILFKEELEPQDYEYREGRDYEICSLLKQGSYGDVYSIRDKSTGFVCAAKKVPLEKFSSEEVGSWSALQSPHVVELFGFVREGLSVILFMDLKPCSLGQLLTEQNRLPEDLSLHYLQQVLAALEHLHKRHILHLDIKADNVLVSEDGRNTFLCDFGQSEQLNHHGFSACQDLKGTETHMAPEVARCEKRCAKADVWSSCCMLLHMLNGCQPWTRYYTRPLYLKIAEEPPPLREIPPTCHPCTADIIKKGLQKDRTQRASAKELIFQTTRALKELGGLRSPVRREAYQEPVGKPERYEPTPFSRSSVRQWMSAGQDRRQRVKPRARSRHNQVDSLEDLNKKAEEVEDGIGKKNESFPSPARCIHQQNSQIQKPTEQELRKLERDFFLSSLSQPHSAELQEQLLSCLSSDCLSTRELADKKDSGLGRWSLGPGDDLSSGVFSYNYQSDGQIFSMDWLIPAHQPTPRCFEGVDVCIRDFNGQCLRIRENPRVKVGHIAIGISDQISEGVFSLQTEDGFLVSHDVQVQESGLFLRCVPAPDCSHATRHRNNTCCKTSWSWRVRDGILETRE